MGRMVALLASCLLIISWYTALTEQLPAGLGWSNHDHGGEDVDLNLSVFMLDGTGMLPGPEYFVFYNNLKGPKGAIIHNGDAREGA